MASEHKESTEEEKVHTPPSPVKTPSPTKDGHKNSPHHHHHHHDIRPDGRPASDEFLVPYPTTKRVRTHSESCMVNNSPLQTGVCKTFCRNKGHGFITPDDGGKDLFVHISDIEGDFVLKEGDRVSFKTLSLPMKPSECQCVDVEILEYHGQHEKWFSGTRP